MASTQQGGLPTRKFSTVLPSVASLRSKFEKPGAPPPPPLRTAGSSATLLKSTPSSQSLLKTTSSVQAGLKSPASLSAIKSPATSPGDTADQTSNSIPSSSSDKLPSASEANRLSMVAESADDTRSERSVDPPETHSRRQSIAATNDVRKASVVVSPNSVDAERKPSMIPAATTVLPERKQSVVAITPEQRRSSVVATPERKPSIVPAPPPTAPPKPPEVPPSRAAVSNGVSSVPEPSAEPPAKRFPTEIPAAAGKAEGILYCCDGYSWTLDAMKTLAKELEVKLGKPSYLDPTTCRSQGMSSFIQNCEAIFACLESGTVNGTVRYQIARAIELNKRLALLYLDDKVPKQATDDMLDQLCCMLANEEHGRSSEDWKSVLTPRLIPLVLSAISEERRIVTLSSLESLLTGGKVSVFSQVMNIPEPPPSSNMFLITGFHPDRLDRVAIEFLARGQTAFVSESLSGVKCTGVIFCLPSVYDEQLPSFAEKQMGMSSNITECRSRGLAMVALSAEHPSNWVPHELDHLVFPADATPEDLSRACDLPCHPLKMQGDALEPFRVVAEKARRFSPDSNRDKLRLDIFQNGKNDKINVISAPSGWGKTTLLAEMCRKHNRVVSVLARSVQDQSETVGAVFFFNRMDPAKSNSSAHCIKSICRQLCGSVPGFALENDAVQETLEDPSASALALMDALIVQPATQLSQKGRPPVKKVFVVIDALDECEDFEALQGALNAKWQSVPPWLALICSSQTRPQIVAKHWELTFASNAGDVQAFLGHRLKELWRIPQADKAVKVLMEKSQSNLLWLQICEPILVNLCESSAGGGGGDDDWFLKALDESLPTAASGDVDKAVKFVFDRFVEHDADTERVRQAYSLAVCVPRSFLPVEIYSHCGIESIPPLLIIEDLCVKPIHAKVLDALLSEEYCGVKLDPLKDHSLVSESLEKAYAVSSPTTKMAKRFSAAHGARHARLAEKHSIAKSWFEDFSRLYDAVSECVRETGDSLRLAQDGEDCCIGEDVVDVIRLASGAVSFDTREFPGQVVGRLPATHRLAHHAKQFAVDVLVKKQNAMVALPIHPIFSGLAPAGGALKKVLKHRGPVIAAAESNEFAVTCSGHVGYVWNLSKTEKTGILKGHADEIKCCSFGCSAAAGGGAGATSTITFMCLTGSADSTAKLWQGSFKVTPASVSSPTVFSCTKTFTGHDSTVTCLAYRGIDGNVVFATGSTDKTVIIWDFNSAAAKLRLRGHAGDVRSLVIVDAHSLLTGSHDKTCRLWDYSQGKEIGRLDGHTRDISAIAVKKDASVAFTASFDGIARSFDLKTKKMLKEFKGHTQRINSMALSADGKRLATCSFDSTARVFDAETGELLIVLKGHGNDVNCVRFTSDDQKCITASLDCEARVWCVTKEKIDRYREESKHRHEDQVTCVGLTPQFACSGSSDGTARVWNLQTGASVCELKGHEESLTSVAISPDGTKAITGSEDGEVRVWEISASGAPKELRNLKAHEDSIESVCFSEDGQYVHTASYDKQMFVWDLNTGRTITAGGTFRPTFPGVPASRKQESRHILGPNGSSVGFTLDAAGIAVALLHDDDTMRPRTFGELNDLFYIWEWYTAELS